MNTLATFAFVLAAALQQGPDLSAPAPQTAPSLESGAPAVAAPVTPVLDTDFPDPFVLPAPGGGLVAYATNTVRGGQLVHVQVSTSADGRSWTAPREAMPKTPAWALQSQPDIWAPEVIQANGRYVMYFSARHATLRRPDGLTLCVGTAISQRPEGPFTPRPQPLTCGGRDGLIDASPFRDGNRLWLYAKTDGNCCGAPISFIAQRLAPNGLDLIGDPAPLKGVTNNLDWEGNVVEAPRMVAHGGAYWMFYSANDYGGRAYATGYAGCRRPNGPCQDSARNPILSSTGSGAGALIGPGGESVFDWQGRSWIAFHGWRGRDGDHWSYRALYLAPLDWTTDGPVVGQPVAPSAAATSDAEAAPQ